MVNSSSQRKSQAQTASLVTFVKYFSKTDEQKNKTVPILNKLSESWKQIIFPQVSPSANPAKNIGGKSVSLNTDLNSLFYGVEDKQPHGCQMPTSTLPWAASAACDQNTKQNNLNINSWVY